MRNPAFVCLPFLLCSCFNPIGFGADVRQTLQLKKGLNAVYIYVNPLEPDDDKPSLTSYFPDSITSVYRWKRKGFSELPNLARVDVDQWDIWKRKPGKGESNTLTTIQGGECYIIESQSQIHVGLVGNPVQLRRFWRTRMLSLTGFQVPTDKLPTVADCFSGALGTGKLWKLMPNGEWVEIDADESVRDGTAMLVEAKSFTDFQQPIRVDQLVGDKLIFTHHQCFLPVSNDGTAQQTITVSLKAVEDAPNREVPPVYLWYSTSEIDPSGIVEGRWKPLSESPAVTIPAQTRYSLRLGIPPRQLKKAMEAVLQLTNEDGGFFEQVSLRVEPPEQPSRKGLWLGTVQITNVQDPNSKNAEVARPFNFRALLHVNEEGEYPGKPASTVAHLLRQAIEVYSGDKAHILTNEQKAIEQIRNGAALGGRFSAILFPSNKPVTLKLTPDDGPFGVDGQKASVTVSLPYNYALNPFVHKYHPDHDSRRRQGNKVVDLDDGVESFTVNRRITFTFVSDLRKLSERGDARSLSLPKYDMTDFAGIGSGWGQSVLAGKYDEVVSGIHAKDIALSGFFILSRVSEASDLQTE